MQVYILSEPWLDRAQQQKADSVLTWSMIFLCFLNTVDLSSKWESLKLMHIFWDKGLLYDLQFLNNERICKSMVFGVKSAPAVGAKGTVINMIINRSLTYPFVNMTWLDSDGKYHIFMLGVHIRAQLFNLFYISQTKEHFHGTCLIMAFKTY